MTPEKRAETLLMDFYDLPFVQPSDKRLMVMIAQALREHGNEKLEEGVESLAKMVSRDPPTGDPHRTSWDGALIAGIGKLRRLKDEPSEPKGEG